MTRRVSLSETLLTVVVLSSLISPSTADSANELPCHVWIILAVLITLITVLVCLLIYAIYRRRKQRRRHRPRTISSRSSPRPATTSTTFPPSTAYPTAPSLKPTKQPIPAQGSSSDVAAVAQPPMADTETPVAAIPATSPPGPSNILQNVVVHLMGRDGQQDQEEGQEDIPQIYAVDEGMQTDPVVILDTGSGQTHFSSSYSPRSGKSSVEASVSHQTMSETQASPPHSGSSWWSPWRMISNAGNLFGGGGGGGGAGSSGSVINRQAPPAPISPTTILEDGMEEEQQKRFRQTVSQGGRQVAARIAHLPGVRTISKIGGNAGYVPANTTPGDEIPALGKVIVPKFRSTSGSIDTTSQTSFIVESRPGASMSTSYRSSEAATTMTSSSGTLPPTSSAALGASTIVDTTVVPAPSLSGLSEQKPTSAGATELTAAPPPSIKPSLVRSLTEEDELDIKLGSLFIPDLHVTEPPDESGPLTPAQATVVAAIRAHIGEDVAKTLPYETFARYARGYEFEARHGGQERWIQAACEELDKTLEWRQRCNIDTLLRNPPPKWDLFRRAWITGVVCADNQGHPVLLERISLVDVNTLNSDFTAEELEIYQARNMERLQTTKRIISRRLGRPLYKHDIIIDLNGLSMKALSAKHKIQVILHVSQYYYPETMYKLFLINAPFIFRAVWKVVQPMIHPQTREKIKILGGNYVEELAANGIAFTMPPTP